MKKRILACLLTLCLMVGLASAFGLSASAAGNTYAMSAIYRDEAITVELQPGDKVTISNADELKALAAYTNAGGATAYVTFELTADIVLNKGSFAADGTWSEATEENAPAAFTPIGEAGYDGAAFRGIFDGNGYTVSGLYICDASRSFAGLFGHIEGSAKVMDLNLANCYVSGDYYVGGVAGFAQMSAVMPTIDNCSVNGYVYAATKYAGGLVGGATGLSVTNSTNNATVTGGEVAYGFGGIVGVGNGALIGNCLNNGTIGGNVMQSMVGGIVGLISGDLTGAVTNNANSGAVNARSFKGGIVGSGNDTTA
ncbi:MAG: hypothetical protein IKM08_00855, partial [Clostridia bacterium]|nr:hypothetical protein [Clostridia bacterium]